MVNASPALLQGLLIWTQPVNTRIRVLAQECESSDRMNGHLHATKQDAELPGSPRWDAQFFGDRPAREPRQEQCGMIPPGPRTIDLWSGQTCLQRSLYYLLSLTVVVLSFAENAQDKDLARSLDLPDRRI
jgi:hypothetical protein